MKRVEAAVAARELAEKRLEAEQSKFEVGMSTNFFVVQAQRDLRDAQNTELRALADYRKSLVTFERAQEAPGGGGGERRRRDHRQPRRVAAAVAVNNTAVQRSHDGDAAFPEYASSLIQRSCANSLSIGIVLAVAAARPCTSVRPAPGRARGGSRRSKHRADRAAQGQPGGTRRSWGTRRRRRGRRRVRRARAAGSVRR